MTEQYNPNQIPELKFETKEQLIEYFKNPEVLKYFDILDREKAITEKDIQNAAEAIAETLNVCNPMGTFERNATFGVAVMISMTRYLYRDKVIKTHLHLEDFVARFMKGCILTNIFFLAKRVRRPKDPYGDTYAEVDTDNPITVDTPLEEVTPRLVAIHDDLSNKLKLVFSTEDDDDDDFDEDDLFNVSRDSAPYN